MTNDSDQERRIGNKEMAGGELERAEGVGGWHKETPPPQGGGGYLDYCIISEHPCKGSRDARLDELRSVGLGPTWILVAERIGFDAFVVLWQTLHESTAEAQTGSIRVRIPGFGAWLRFQRNCYIRALAAEGWSSQEISGMVYSAMKMQVSERQIDRVVAARAGREAEAGK